MASRNTNYEVTASVDGKPVVVTKLDLLEDFRLLPLDERMKRTIDGEFDDIEIYLASVAPNSQAIKMRYRGK